MDDGTRDMWAKVVDEVTCCWKAWNNTTKVWEVQADGTVEAVCKGTVMVNYSGTPLHCVALLGVACTCSVLLDACCEWASETCVDVRA